MKALHLKSLKIFVSLFLLALFTDLYSQPPVLVGRIYDQAHGQSFVLYSDGMMIQDGNPMNKGIASRDPSGIMYLRLPAANPYQKAFFLDYNKNVIELDYMLGSRIIGFADIQIPPNPMIQYIPPVYSQNVGIQTATGFQPLPSQIVDTNNPYGDLMITNGQTAKGCYDQSIGFNGALDRQKFGDCMVANMAGKKENEIYNCVKNASTPEEQALCLVGTMGGTNEKRISASLLKCYKQYGNDYSKYPLCLAGESSDPELQRLLSCVQQQGQYGQVSFMNTAVCYGAGKLNLNTEAQIVVQCAVTSGGQPYVFAGCAGGQLMARELDKCFTDGVGGDSGCFGKNNDIVKGLNKIGSELQNQFGPTNDIVRTWNTTVHDIQYGPGKNHEAVKILTNVGNELGKAGNNIGKEIKKVLPRIKW
ncbi:hypothetical protein JET18_19075 [Chryseobacterium sp. L7]|uniref:Conjugal transfer protein TraN n=1 Tax=Chryseobacterium endalhagicum TaxID=2797638 RepID=A0ABS1QK23_9FLAO|nr:hypothetical protein [Chryseobacterium endalhagicum]MBL1222964.1 hypothetical protein [Chryseobacterium endalhagicum]